MFTTKLAVNSVVSNSRSTAWRSFSKTTATFADQYDVVVLGKFRNSRFDGLVPKNGRAILKVEYVLSVMYS